MSRMSRHASFLFRHLSLCLGALAILSTTISVRAQVLVDLSIKRSLYIAYEPLLATVRITNLSGNKLLLADVEGKKWFSFHIETLEGRPIPPTDPNYEIPPLQLGSGESISRTVNLTQLYPLSDFGSYRVKAAVYAAELNAYFSSPPLTVEITEGRLLWEQTVGVPQRGGSAGASRTISLLSHRLSEHTDLYLRIADKEAGIVYCTHRLGDFIAYGKPEVILDAENTVHVLQNSSPHQFIYSKVGLDGKILERSSFQSIKDRPQLRRATDGTVVVVGGIFFDPRATPTPSVIAKLSDRPPALPLPSPSPGTTKKKLKSSADHGSKSSAKNAKPSPSSTPLLLPVKND